MLRIERLRSPFTLIGISVVSAVLAGFIVWQTHQAPPIVASEPRPSTTVAPLTSTTAKPPAPTTVLPRTTVVQAPKAAPAPRVPQIVAAPLTGLPVLDTFVNRPAIISKIDGSTPAMPQVGLEQADVVIEAKIEWGWSRYITIWHSQDPKVIGPHRSARTTDANLISMFGIPYFAYSGANKKVVDFYSRVPGKIDVAHGAIPEAFFRDNDRPWPHNLMALPSIFRTRSGEQRWPAPIFKYRAQGAAPSGRPVDQAITTTGPPAFWKWDPARHGWTRIIHGKQHVDATGVPLAPTNVVVIETQYITSFADANSPEALSLGVGKAWVLSEGRVTGGIWKRVSRNGPYELLDAKGAPMLLTPGTTWISLADRDPEFVPAN